MLKHLKYYLVALFVALDLLATTSQADVSKNSGASFLFVQNAKSGILQTDKANPNHYKFTLESVSPYVIYFSDRPKRISGLTTPEKFIELWQNNPKNNNFAKDAPNVGVNAMKVHSLFHKQDYSFVMVLTHPVYNKAKKTITYDANIVPGANSSMPANNTKYKDVVLFFDNIMDPCTDAQCCPLC